MKSNKLNTKTAFSIFLFYLFGSMFIYFFSYILFGSSNNKTIVEATVDSTMISNIIISGILLFVCFTLFRDNLKDIFFERVKFNLSKFYWILPGAYLVVVAIGLFNIEYSLIAFRFIILVSIASLAISINEELIFRGFILVGLRNDKVSEWKVYIITLVAFSLSHLINLITGGSLLFILVQFVAGTTLYVSRRISGTLIIPIIMHALYDTAFFLLPGPYQWGNLPDYVLNIQFNSFLVLFVLFVMFLIFGRNLLKNKTTGWH